MLKVVKIIDRLAKVSYYEVLGEGNCTKVKNINQGLQELS